MSEPYKHARVKELFLKALEFAPHEREGFLRRVEATPEILEQVLELLRHASTVTVLDVRAAQPTSQRQSVSRFTPFLNAIAPFASTRRRQWITGAVLLAIVLVGGQYMRSSARTLAEGQAISTLQAIEASNSSAFLAQLQEWSAAVESTVMSEWAHQSVVAAIRSATAENLTVFHQEAQSLLAPGRFETYFLADASGMLKSVNGEPVEPSPATPYGMNMFSRAFTYGKIVDVSGVQRAMTALGEDGQLTPSVTIYVPIEEEGQPVGVFAATHSIAALSDALQQAQIFESGESYIFSAEGLMLSPSRFVDDMRRWGLVKEPIGPDAEPIIYLRDPGRALASTDGLLEGEDPATWPRTLLVRTAVAGRDSLDPARASGLLKEPYRDYRGELVVSSWRWAPELGVGFATDVDAYEIQAVADLVDRGLLALLALTAIGGGWIIVTSGWLMRLRGEVHRRDSLGQYSLIEKIGEGGMGEVYMARHSMLKRTAALKLLRRDRASENAFRQFENEVQIISQLRHPNTVEVYDFGRAADGTFYYVMQYLPGLDLGEWVSRNGKMPPAQALHVVRQVCSALSEAHEEGLLHRDVKPSNVMLCSMGGLRDFVKLLDFGLAQAVHNAGEESGPLDRSGTPYYTAPERLEPGGKVDARCDVYSLGVLWYYLLTARLPHGAGVHWVEATLTMDSVPVSSHVKVDAATEELLMRCISRNPEDRPRNATALLLELNKLAADNPWTYWGVPPREPAPSSSDV